MCDEKPTRHTFAYRTQKNLKLIFIDCFNKTMKFNNGSIHIIVSPNVSKTPLQYLEIDFPITLGSFEVLRS